MPTRDILNAPDVLCLTAKKIARHVKRYKASRNASDYLQANTAISEARILLDYIEDLMRELAARR